ncbi:hypothetical protein BCR37DRAFT_153153 [Protomyces lactucae-debilis]|uniref:Uncharacterized protein n=1 Tax=Protomyces lactucae-debilis TaxID=2754530 RepID=A0A1Y2F0H1_PROLT|nr:uncharacterized protein BCR37DRAFT_153153 [Protomyces lactucae-debilis]ORY77333.1 hypothetical protein BCR37DRAFT_153153 [Protomyces lactucae-debilis]
MRQKDATAILFWIMGAMIMLPVSMFHDHIGRQDDKINKVLTRRNMDYPGPGCQRWQFKFQKTLQWTVEDFHVYDDCETMCRVVFLEDFTAALNATNTKEGEERKLDGCVADSGVCAGLSLGTFQTDKSCHCRTILIALRLHGGSDCKRDKLHKRIAQKLVGHDRNTEDVGHNWNIRDEPEILQSGLYCHQRKASHCSCATLDPKYHYYGLPHGKECPAEVRGTSTVP